MILGRVGVGETGDTAVGECLGLLSGVTLVGADVPAIVCRGGTLMVMEFMGLTEGVTFGETSAFMWFSTIPVALGGREASVLVEITSGLAFGANDCVGWLCPWFVVLDSWLAV